MRPPLAQDYYRTLRAEFEAERGRTPALRLWRAAEKVFPDWFKGTMDRARSKLRRRHVTPEHVDILARMLDREADLLAARQLDDDTRFLLAENLIDRNAGFDDLAPEELYFTWSAVGTAFNHAAYDWKILPVRRKRVRPAALLETCELCWRTGPVSRQGKFHCARHIPRANNSDYKRARKINDWQSPKQEHSGIPYLRLRLRELRRSVPSGLESLDPSDLLLQRIRCGDIEALSRFPLRFVDLDALWPAFPCTRRFLERRKKRRPNLADPRGVLLALDPLGASHQHVHYAQHVAMLRDQRLLIEMLHEAEAWLSAAEERRRHHGGRREKARHASDTDELVKLPIGSE